MCRFKVLFAVLLVLFSGADSPQWGIDQGRNRISSEENLPVSFQPGRKDPATGDIAETGKNVRWAVKIGSRTYTPPVIADGCVLIGTNNDAKFDANIDGDYGIMLCLDEKTGKFRWQYAAKKVSEIQHFDTVQIGITSTPLVRNGIVYFVDNRGTVCAVNLADGKPKWTFDLVKVLGVRQHDANNCSITIHENWLFAGTANGLDARHSNMERPDAPTLVVLDAATGKPLARDDAWLKTGIVHGQWCSPCLGAVKQADGSVVPTLFYVLGNGILHSVNLQKFRQQLAAPPENIGQFGADLPKIAADWTFDGNGKEIWGEDQPFQKGRGSASYCCLPPPVFADNKLYLLFCFDDAIGARPHKAFLTAINPVNGLAAGKRLLWKTPDITNGTLSPQAAADGLIYLGDKNGGFHCLDAQTGQSVWKLDLKGEHWGGALIADGRIYAGTNRRMFYVLQAGREPKILSEIEMPDAVFAGASAANGTLFVAGNGFLYAVEK